MRVNFDSEALSDPRFKRVARRLRIPLPHVFGCCVVVWNECYTMRSPLLLRDTVDALAELDGFADTLITCDLAEDQPDGVIRLRGVEDRIRWLKGQDDKSARGVAARKRSGDNKEQPTGHPRVTHGSPQGQPPGDPLGSGLWSLVSEDPPPGDLGERAPKVAPKPSKPRKRRLDASWEPTPKHAQQARELGLNLHAEAESFRDHHASKGTEFADPDAGFRNWLRNAQRFARAGPRRSTTAGDLLPDLLDDIAAMERS